MGLRSETSFGAFGHEFEASIVVSLMVMWPEFCAATCSMNAFADTGNSAVPSRYQGNTNTNTNETIHQISTYVTSLDEPMLYSQLVNYVGLCCTSSKLLLTSTTQNRP